MKILFKVTIAIVFTIFMCSCVQKTYDKTVLYCLDTRAIDDVRTVGIRGNDKPLNWESDFPMKLDTKDNLYKAYVTTKTGYLNTEIKFTVNGEFELKDASNRKVSLHENDTVKYVAVFNQPK
ncbi:hypothetical protein [Flavobacterium pallidum]|uniref:Uncharacterized protein n=1 Tax=Flavobacterium pallidum TaxID=2172098 RepID=A0A2S1SK84_9FLAO|nr:hypothetical protein [Flavobacterium pallidum]AWI26766.1 hypothetical protein HYN49_13160 [Flavobacterium pallidum]